MQILESRIERSACRQIFERLGVESIKLTPEQSAGYPDRLFWLPGGRPVLIEFKVPGGRVSPKQEHVHAKLRRLRYPVFICESVNDAFNVIKDELRVVCRER